VNVALYQASPFEAIKQINKHGREFWSARDLQAPLGYDKWQNFEDCLERAMAACENSGYEPLDHFPDVSKIVKAGATSKPVQDFHLTRFACYLTAMNGDPRKPEIAAAQTYFAIKTREAEINQSQSLFAPTKSEFDFHFTVTCDGVHDVERARQALVYIEKAHILLSREIAETAKAAILLIEERKSGLTLRERILQVLVNQSHGTRLTCYQICRLGGLQLRKAGTKHAKPELEAMLAEGLVIKEGSGNARYGLI